MPPLLDAGGTGLVFGVFAAFFVVGALATWGLPELRGRALEEDAAAQVLVRTTALRAQ